MSDPHKRLHTLLTDRALAGLAARGEEELQYLLAGGAVDPSYERAAAAIELALHDHGEPVPEYIEAAVLVQAERYHGFTEAKPHEQTIGRPAVAADNQELGEDSLLDDPEADEAPDDRDWEQSDGVDAALESGVLESSLTDGRIEGGKADESQRAPIISDLEQSGRASKHAPKRKKKKKKKTKAKAKAKRAEDNLLLDSVDDVDAFEGLDELDDGAEPRPDAELGFDPATISQSDLGPALSVSQVRPVPLGESRVARWATYISAIAALVMLSIALWLFSHRDEGTSPGDLRAQIESAEDLVEWTFVTKPDPSVGEGATGSVLWSSTLQAGVMVLDGLAPNDPKDIQYQLWIVDKLREGPSPVDGGVFNIDAAGEAVIQIDAKLVVGEPGAFVITVERPGGVVVSDQERVAMVAAAG